MNTPNIQAPFTSGPEDLVALVPRVDVHVFCETQEVGQAAQVAGADRRMARAHVTIQLGGIAAAVQVYQSQPTPSVLIVECMGGREQVMADLGKLAEVCQPDSKVMVVGHMNDVVLYRELIRQGISEYLVAPISPFQIIETISNLFADPKAKPLGRVISFVGAKGGVGSSTIAHNVAWALSQKHNLDTIVTDLDLAFGTAALNFNSEASGGMVDALGSPERVDATLIDRLMTKINDKLSLLNGPGSVDRDLTFDGAAVETILNVVRYSSPIVVVDVPNMWAPWIKHTLVNSDEIVITATPELPSLRNAKNLFDLLKSTRPNDKAPKLVLNQTGIPKRPEISAADFGKAIGVDPSAIIPHDPQSFGLAQGNGQMIFEVAAKSKSAEHLDALARILSNLQPLANSKPAAKGASFLSKFPLLKKKQA